MLALAGAPAAPRERMRPFDMSRDLGPLADLVDLAFSSERDGVRGRVVGEMRRAARTGPLLWLAAVDPTGQSTMGGYVWMAGQRLVGNVTLCRDPGFANLYVISNVAVHPDWRNRGIAAQLLRAALQEAGRRSARLVTLEVQQENTVAHHLYDRLGFATYDSVAELSRPPAALPSRMQAAGWPGANLTLRRQRAADTDSLLQLVCEATPAPARAVRPPRQRDLQLDLAARLDRFLDDVLYRRQRGDWVVEREGRVVALLQAVGQYGDESHRLRIEVLPSERGRVEDGLLRHGLAWLSRFPDHPLWASVSCAHPEALSAFRLAGFETVRILDQLQVDPRDVNAGSVGASQ